MNSKDRFQRLPGKRYLDKSTGQIVSNSVKRRIQTGVSPGKFAKIQREKGVANPLKRYNRLVDLRTEQQQHEKRLLINTLESELKRGVGKPEDRRQLREQIAALKAEKVTRGKVSKSEEMKLLLRDLKSEQGRVKRGKHIKGKPDKIYSPESRRAKALEELGLRDRGARHWVGDS